MMKLVIIAVLANFASLDAQVPVDGVVTWRERDRAIESLTAEQDLGTEAIAAAKTWATWAAERDYRLVLTDDGSVLLVFSKTYARRQGRLKDDRVMLQFLSSVEKTIAEVDRLIPPALIPGARSKTVVVVGVRQEHYADVLEAVATQHEPLRDWASAAASNRSGFVLSEPLVAVWIEDPPGMEEWRRENEVVHRAAAELLAQYAPHLPDWLQVGVAWHIEERVMDSIYCLPYRTGFVSIYEHTDWDRNLSQMFRRRRRTPLDLQEVAEWIPRQGYDQDKANMAFGIGRYLADHVTESLPPILRELNEQITEKRKVSTGEFTWNIDTNYRLPIPEQLALLQKHAGETFLTEVTRFFIEGKNFRPRSKRR
jgi:hypothetical protein